jgi:hypothetical protein
LATQWTYQNASGPWTWIGEANEPIVHEKAIKRDQPLYHWWQCTRWCKSHVTLISQVKMTMTLIHHIQSHHGMQRRPIIQGCNIKCSHPDSPQSHSRCTVILDRSNNQTSCCWHPRCPKRCHQLQGS